MRGGTPIVKKDDYIKSLHDSINILRAENEALKDELLVDYNAHQSLRAERDALCKDLQDMQDRHVSDLNQFRMERDTLRAQLEAVTKERDEAVKALEQLSFGAGESLLADLAKLKGRGA